MHRARPYALLFLALTAIYHSNLRPIAAGDSLPAALIPFSVVLDHAVSLDRFGPWLQDNTTYGFKVVHQTRGHWYSIFPIAGPVLVSPLYLPAAVIPALRRLPPESLIALARIVEKFTAVALTAASAVWMLALLGRLAPMRWAWALTWVFALCTATWSTSSQALWQHTFGAMAIIGCWYFLERWETEDRTRHWAWWCGAAVAAALMIRLTNATLLLALAAALWQRRARGIDYVRMLAPAAVAAVLVAAYNHSALGTFTGGYPTPLNASALHGLAGILFSPGRGLLIYTPIALFALTAFLPAARENRARHPAVLTACAVFAVAQIAVVAKWPLWWGGYCWGPRLLTEIVPGLMVLIAAGLPAIRGATRYAFAAVAVYCFFIQALGVYYYPKGRWDHLPVSVDQDQRRLWNWSDNPIARTLKGGPAWEPYAIVKTALKEGLPAAAERLLAYGISAY